MSFNESDDFQRPPATSRFDWDLRCGVTGRIHKHKFLIWAQHLFHWPLEPLPSSSLVWNVCRHSMSPFQWPLECQVGTVGKLPSALRRCLNLLRANVWPNKGRRAAKFSEGDGPGWQHISWLGAPKCQEICWFEWNQSNTCNIKYTHTHTQIYMYI